MEWISVKDKLPERGQCIIVFGPNIADYVDLLTTMQYFGTISQAVTHWMPLPETPKFD